MMAGIILISTALLVFLSMPLDSCAICNSNTIGTVECVLLTPYYNEYQWATCLTDAYILRASDQTHQCRRGPGTICYYQCQLELNGFEYGQVFDNCRCSTTDTLPTPGTLAPRCFSPDGIDCSWYRECLEARYPCEGTSDGYAIEYALKYCNLYSDNYNDFSPSARLWINGVRKCLQVVLVPSLRPWVVKTCAQLSQDAFGSHANCYTNPGSGAPSICALPIEDSLRVFFIVNFVGNAFFSAPQQTGQQMIDVMRICYGTNIFTNALASTVMLAVRGVELYQDTRSVLVGITQSIAELLNFDANGIGWFPYFDDDEDTQRRRRRDARTQGVGNVMVLLADLKLLNTSNGTTSNRVVNGETLQEAITSLSDAVNNGELSRIPVVINGNEVLFGVSSLGRCDGIFCSNSTNVTLLATAPPPTKSGTLRLCVSPKNMCNYAIIIYIFALLFV